MNRPTRERTTVGAFARLRSGGTPAKNRPDYWDGDIAWVSPKDMKTFRLKSTGLTLTLAGAANGTTIVPKGTVLVLVRGMTLHRDVPICITGTEMAFNQDVKALNTSSDIDNEYLAYWLLGNKRRLLSLVDSASHGTGRINTKSLEDLELELPSRAEREELVNVIRDFDEKIELNRRMNETLEAIAQAIFESWFVDFDPVRAKIEGRHPCGMDAATASLFPDSFQDSPLGKIPTGSSTTQLGDVA